LDSYENGLVLLDTINSLKQRFDYEDLSALWTYYEVKAYLTLALEMQAQKKMPAGERYIGLFEQKIMNEQPEASLKTLIEKTYHTYAWHYYRERNNQKSRHFVNRGLKYVPNSYNLNRFLTSLR
jgi:hypothetical protein